MVSEVLLRSCPMLATGTSCSQFLLEACVKKTMTSVTVMIPYNYPQHGRCLQRPFTFSSLIASFDFLL